MRVIGKILLGLLASLGFMVIVLTAVMIYLFSTFGGGGKQVATATGNVVLTLDLDTSLPEIEDGGFQNLGFGNKTTFQDLLLAVRRAKDDPRIVGIAAVLSGQSLGLAQTEDVREVIADFRASGKPVMLFSDTIGEGVGALPAYYLATAFQELWMQPSGMLGIAGIGVEQPFFKDFLARFGIKASFMARKEYKSAAENLTDSQMSEPNREALEALLGTWFEQMVLGTAADRRMGPEKMKAYVDGGPITAQAAQAAGLIDQLGYMDQFEAALEAKTKNARRVTVSDYMKFPAYAGQPEPTKRIAVIHGVGTIMRGKVEQSPFGGDATIGSETMSKAIREAAEDDDIDAILMRVDSPGGSYVASDTIWREVVRAKERGKPVIVSMGDTAASGGYFISMAADRIFAQPSTVTGSIGVVLGKIVIGEATEKLDINWERITLGDSAGMFSSVRDFTPEDRARLDKSLDAIYADFTTKAAQGRGKDVADLERVARGRVWSGADAVSAGLVDELGGFSRAIDYTKEVLGVKPGEPAALVAYPPVEDPWVALFKSLEEDELPFGLMSFARAMTWFGQVVGPIMTEMGLARTQGPLLYNPAVSVN